MPTPRDATYAGSHDGSISTFAILENSPMNPGNGLRTKCQHGGNAPTVRNTPSGKNSNRPICELPVQHPANFRHKGHHPGPPPELVAAGVNSLQLGQSIH